MRRLLTTTAVVAIGLAVAGIAPASAALIDFGFQNFPAAGIDEGVTHTFSNGGVSIIGKAEAGAGDLFGKHDGGDENGLGTTGDTSGEHEIQAGHGYVQIDISGLIGKVTAATVDFGIGSSTNGEQWEVWGTNEADLTTNHFNNGHATLLASGTNEFASLGLADVGAFQFLDFRAVGTDHSGSASNFLIADITATAAAAVPEPASLALFAVGLLGTVAAAKRKRS